MLTYYKGTVTGLQSIHLYSESTNLS